MNCETFLSRPAGQPHDQASLEHLRSCPTCIESAVLLDADDLFRSLGGEMDPPGGTDLFVGEVLREIEVRQTERRLSPARRVVPAYRWAAAAALVAGVVTASLHRFDTPAPSSFNQPQVVRSLPASGHPAINLSAAVQPEQSRPVVESYENGSATIVEVPADRNDVAVVMIFDQNLPADL